jgi:tetratricopeptide (TPR) repeat protein
VLPKGYLRALRQLVRPAVDAGKRTLRGAFPALPAPSALLALPPPDPADPLRRQLPVPVAVRPLALLPSLTSWLPLVWREPRRRASPPRSRRGARHSLATLTAALALTICSPLLLSSERIADRLEPALGLFLGDTPWTSQRHEVVLVGPESAPPFPQAPAMRADGVQATAERAGEQSPGEATTDDAAAEPGSGLPSNPIVTPPGGEGSWANLYQLGHTLWSAGKVDDAITAFTGASDLNPEHPAIAYDLGWALQRAGRGDEALEHYRRAIELRPDHAFANYNLGFLLKERGRDDEAAELLGRAVELLPGNAYAAFDYATLLERQGALVAAAEMYLRAKQSARGTSLAADANRRLDRVEAALKERSQS